MSKDVKNKLVFTTKTQDGKALQLAVKKPDVEQSRELQKVWNVAFNDAIVSKAPVRAKLSAVAREQKLWDDAKDEELKKLQKELFSAEYQFDKGGIGKNAAKKLALRVKEIREEISQLQRPVNELDSRCAESQAETEKFSHAVALCTFDPETGDKFFKDYADFKARENDTATQDAARYFALLSYNLDPNYESNLFENKFLKSQGFVNEELRLINKQGKLVDQQGRLIREDGRFINEKNELVDGEGKLVDEKGNYKVEFTPFFDDDEVEAKVDETPVVTTQKK